MRCLVKGLLMLAAAVLVSAPAPARASLYVNPWAGIMFGNPQAETGTRSAGVAVGSASQGVWGSEVSVGFAPSVFGSRADNSLLDFMGGFTAGPSFGRMGRSVRPYALGEVGTIRTKIGTTSNAPSFIRSDGGVSVGGGVSADLNLRIALRADVRYFRAFNAENPPNTLNIDVGNFHYWRAQVGIMIY